MSKPVSKRAAEGARAVRTFQSSLSRSALATFTCRSRWDFSARSISRSSSSSSSLLDCWKSSSSLRVSASTSATSMYFARQSTDVDEKLNTYIRIAGQTRHAWCWTDALDGVLLVRGEHAVPERIGRCKYGRHDRAQQSVCD
jgi:hypothetical protein